MNDHNDGGGFPIVAAFAVLVVIVTGLGFVAFLFTARSSVPVSAPAPVTSSIPVAIDSLALPATSDETESVSEDADTTKDDAAASSN